MVGLVGRTCDIVTDGGSGWTGRTRKCWINGGCIQLEKCIFGAVAAEGDIFTSEETMMKKMSDVRLHLWMQRLAHCNGGMLGSWGFM